MVKYQHWILVILYVNALFMLLSEVELEIYDFMKLLVIILSDINKVFDAPIPIRMVDVLPFCSCCVTECTVILLNIKTDFWVSQRYM